MSLEDLISSAICMIQPDDLEDAIIEQRNLITEEAIKTLYLYLSPQSDKFLTNLESVLDSLSLESIIEFIAFKNPALFDSMIVLSDEGLSVNEYFEDLLLKYKNITLRLIEFIRRKRNERTTKQK